MRMSSFIVEALQILRDLYQKKSFILMWKKFLNQKAEIMLPCQLPIAHITNNKRRCLILGAVYTLEKSENV